MTTRSDAPETLLGVGAAAKMARRSPETVRRWVWSGKLAASRQGRRLLIARDDLTALLVRLGADAAPVTLAQWAAAARQRSVSAGGPFSKSAADLVLADRRDRSGE